MFIKRDSYKCTRLSFTWRWGGWKYSLFQNTLCFYWVEDRVVNEFNLVIFTEPYSISVYMAWHSVGMRKQFWVVVNISALHGVNIFTILLFTSDFCLWSLMLTLIHSLAKMTCVYLHDLAILSELEPWEDLFFSWGFSVDFQQHITCQRNEKFSMKG